jgi:hypothetical protein
MCDDIGYRLLNQSKKHLPVEGPRESVHPQVGIATILHILHRRGLLKNMATTGFSLYSTHRLE